MSDAEQSTNQLMVLDSAPAKPAKKKKAPAKVSKRSREVSSLGFPYNDLENAITVARALLSHGNQLSRDQLAGALGQSPVSGAFILKLSSARQFGLVDLKDSRFALSDLGFSILDTNEAREKTARVQAFLNVPLYKRIYESFRGRQLPPRGGLENAIVQAGVAPKQKSNARLAFEKSAKQAGFFNVDSERLIEPPISSNPSVAMTDGTEVTAVATVTPPAASDTHLDPLIRGLLARMPKAGDAWPTDARKKWLATLEANLEMIYPESK